jgi:hypothetical protein
VTLRIVEGDEKKIQVPGGVTGPPCHWWTKIQRPVPPHWGLEARLTTLLWEEEKEEKKSVKSKEVKTGWSNS